MECMSIGKALTENENNCKDGIIIIYFILDSVNTTCCLTTGSYYNNKVQQNEKSMSNKSNKQRKYMNKNLSLTYLLQRKLVQYISGILGSYIKEASAYEEINKHEKNL